MATFVLIHGGGGGAWDWHHEMGGSHCAMVSRPREMADRLESFRAGA